MNLSNNAKKKLLIGAALTTAAVTLVALVKIRKDSKKSSLEEEVTKEAESSLNDVFEATKDSVKEATESLDKTSKFKSKVPEGFDLDKFNELRTKVNSGQLSREAFEEYLSGMDIQEGLSKRIKAESVENIFSALDKLKHAGNSDSPISGLIKKLLSKGEFDSLLNAEGLLKNIDELLTPKKEEEKVEKSDPKEFFKEEEEASRKPSSVIEVAASMFNKGINEMMNAHKEEHEVVVDGLLKEEQHKQALKELDKEIDKTLSIKFKYSSKAQAAKQILDDDFKKDLESIGDDVDKKLELVQKYIELVSKIDTTE